ncbi:hypothetical protein M0R45_008419 [Rubus argutus]|uniref:Uncharacterized protein n=1 Tax=Rubus argutus TaxID=59490 RepID=A0AAW1Y236_RUBAR
MGLKGNFPRVSRTATALQLNLAHNQLSGPIPSDISDLLPYANNKGLCGFPLEPCNSNNNNKRKSDVHSSEVPFGIGYALSFIAMFISCLVPWTEIKMEMKWIAFYMLEKRNKRKQAHNKPIKFKMNFFSKNRFEKTINRMSFTELSKATGSFSLGNVIGFGKMGTMYKATLANGWFLAVKSGMWESDFVKKDVYDYGIVLVELITGKEHITSGSSNSLHKTLVEWIDHVSTSSFILNDAIDKHLIGQGFDDDIIQFLKIASDCVQPYPYQRSTMLQVYRAVTTIGQKYDIPCQELVFMARIKNFVKELSTD